MNERLSFVATCPKGVESLLAGELRALGAEDVRETVAAVTFLGPLSVGYRACLWSRLASRVLLTLAEFPSATAEELYAGVREVPWEEHVPAEGTLAVDAVGTTVALTHTGFTARKVKDAVVDRLRERFGVRPSVDLEAPDVRLNLRLRKDRAALSLDLSGDPLHRRGYRLPGEQVEAPLKENLAAAILVRAGWPEVAGGGGALLDPMCGSGTLPIEAALIAKDQAPGLLRRRWGFLGWLGHDDELWASLLDEADERAEEGRARDDVLIGLDADPRALEIARGNAKRAGLGDSIRFESAALTELAPPEDARPGLVVTNPPYGERLGRAEDLRRLYALLGRRLAERFDGWLAAVFTSEEELARAIGLRSHKSYLLYNGPIATRLYLFSLGPENVLASPPPARSQEPAGQGAEQLANRLRKNLRHLRKWARREQVSCFRVYDADLPEYAAAIDLYQGAGPDEGRRLAHVQEYAPPPSVDPALAERRLAEILNAVSEVLEVAPSDVASKVRRRQRGAAQYDRISERGEYVQVAEGGLGFLVNLHDYLDTGLFLDHRPVRARIRELAAGTTFLNLFAYTGTASVYAAAGGATATVSVDMSARYVDWARRNMGLNGFDTPSAGRDGCPPDAAHCILRADVLTWVADERERILAGRREPYGLIFLDPPTFSNSKRMDRPFDVQRDHAPLLLDAASILHPRGVLLFSTNLRTFELDEGAIEGLRATDITGETIPPDFSRNPRIHRVFLITKE